MSKTMASSFGKKKQMKATKSKSAHPKSKKAATAG